MIIKFTNFPQLQNLLFSDLTFCYEVKKMSTNFHRKMFVLLVFFSLFFVVSDFLLYQFFFNVSSFLLPFFLLLTLFLPYFIFGYLFLSLLFAFHSIFSIFLLFQIFFSQFSDHSQNITSISFKKIFCLCLYVNYFLLIFFFCWSVAC